MNLKKHYLNSLGEAPSMDEDDDEKPKVKKKKTLKGKKYKGDI